MANRDRQAQKEMDKVRHALDPRFRGLKPKLLRIATAYNASQASQAGWRSVPRPAHHR